MRSISIPWSSLFRRSLKVISTFFTSFLAWALLLYNIWAHCTCKLLDWGFTSFVANDSLTHTLISREECTDLATARPLLLEKEYELNLDIKKEGDKNKQKRLWPISFVQKLRIRKIFVFCTITLQHLSYRLRRALQDKKNKKNQQQQRLRCLFFEKSWGLFGLEMPAVKLKSTCFGKLVF